MAYLTALHHRYQGVVVDHCSEDLAASRRPAARPRPPYPSYRLHTLQRNRQPSRTRNPSDRPGAARRSPRYPWQGCSPGRMRGRSRERRRAQCCPQPWTSIPTMPRTHHGTPHLASRARRLPPQGRAQPSPETPLRTGRKQGPRTEQGANAAVDNMRLVPLMRFHVSLTIRRQSGDKATGGK